MTIPPPHLFLNPPKNSIFSGFHLGKMSLELGNDTTRKFYLENSSCSASAVPKFNPKILYSPGNSLLFPSIFYSQSRVLLRKCDPECNSGNNLEALIPSTTTTKTNFLFWCFRNKNRRQKAETFKKTRKKTPKIHRIALF